MTGLPTSPTAAITNDAATSTRTAGSSLAVTEGRSPLAQGEQVRGQVLASQVQPNGSYKVEVQLATGQQLSLVTSKPLPAGQEVQLTGKTATQLELRPANLQQLSQTLINQLANLPSIKLQLANPSLPSLPLNTASLASVTASQTLTNNQGYLITLQLGLTKSSLQVISNQPLTNGSPVYLATNSQGELSARLLSPVQANLAQLLANQLPLVAPSVTAASGFTTSTSSSLPSPSLASLLATASEQLRYALPRQAPLQTSLSQLSNLLPQLARLTASSATATPNPAPTNASTTSPMTSLIHNLTTSSTGSSTATLSSILSSVSSSASSSTLATVGKADTATRLTTLIQQLISSFPNGNNPPNAASLQSFIQNSGMFLEANLLSSSSKLTGDIKFQLHQLANLVRQEASANPNPARQEVLQQVNQQLQTMTSRLEVQQLSSLQAIQASAERGQPAQLVQMDLPYAIRGEWFEAKLEIRRWLEEKETEEALEELLRRTKIWEVRLQFTLPSYGKLHTHLRLQDEQLNADIWIEEKTAFSPIKQEAEVLAARLRRLGAEIEQVNCYLGEPAQQHTQQKPNKAQIINTKI